MGTGSMQHSRGDGKASNKSKSVFWCGVATKKKGLKVCEVLEREMETGGFGDGGEIGRI